MNQRQFRSMITLTALAVLVLSAITMGAEVEKVVIQSPPTVGALPLLWMKASGVLTDQVEFEFVISDDHQRGLALISQKEIDMLITGVNVGVNAYNKGINLRLVNTNIWGIDYLLTNFPVEQWKDLEGKSLSVPLQGGPLDFLARYFLLNNGADPEKVQFVILPSNNGARTFQLGKLDAIILPEPMVTITLQNYADAVLAFDLQAEWAKLHDGDDRIPFVGLFVRGDFADKHHKLVETINQYYQEGINWVKENPADAAALASEYFGQPAAIVQQSLARINLNLYPDDQAKLIETYCQEVLQLYPEMIGGKLPDAQFYF